jgi:LuxR family maltose regulon positive regulatory protein
MSDGTLVPARTTWAEEPAEPPISRRRLVDRLHKATSGPLTVVHAPAGFGKSALLRQWAAEAQPVPMGHLTLRRHDSAATIVPRLVAALQAVGALDATRALRHWDPLARTLAPAVRSALARAVQPVREGVLVIDGFDAPRDRSLVCDLAALVAAAPPGLHVTVASRSRPSALREILASRRPELLIDETDLAFTVEEAAALLARLGLTLDDDRAAALVARTGGWPTGLLVAATVLRDADDLDAAIEAFGGHERHVAAYLLDEVLGPESEAVRRFLLHTSVLDRLCAPLCDAATGTHDLAGLLPLLERRGLFLRREAPHSPWFRYQPLFRDALRQALRHSEPEAEGVLLRRAAAWHTAHGDGAAAASCLMEADDGDGLLAVVDRFGAAMFERDEGALVLEWLDALHDVRPSPTSLALRRACAHTAVGETRRAAHVLHEAEARGLQPGEQLVADAVRATWGLWHASPAAVIEAADAVLEHVDTVDPSQIPFLFGATSPTSLRVMAAGGRARARWHLGVGDAARVELTELLDHQHVYEPWRLHVIGALALVEAWAGNLRMAHQHARHAITGAHTLGLARHACTFDARVALAHVALEHNHVRRAGDVLDELDSLTPPDRRPGTAALLLVEQIRWHLAAGRPHEGMAALEAYRASGIAPAPPAVAARLRAAEVRSLVALGDIHRARAVFWSAVAEAEDVAAAGPPGCPPGPPAELLHAGVQAAMADGDAVEARRLLARPSAAGTVPVTRLGHGLWSAVVELEDGDRRRGVRLAAAVVNAAVREEHVRFFLDAGRPAERLLRILDHATPSPYIGLLLAAASEAGAAPGAHGLSERELEVLRYLPTRLANAEIAAQLYVSLNTLKTHLRAIYRKLGVNGRAAAIRRAAELGIV